MNLRCEHFKRKSIKIHSSDNVTLLLPIHRREEGYVIATILLNQRESLLLSITLTLFDLISTIILLINFVYLKQNFVSCA